MTKEGYVVMARRHRPRRLEDIVGQDVFVQAATNALRAGTSAHAYLLCGHRGCGKTSAARILACCLNCQEIPRPGPDACGRCQVCASILAGAARDVTELDAASNRRVDEMRSLCSSAQYRPETRRRVFIIDECHMLVKESWATLLKVMEEPPPHAVFLLATTEPEEVPTAVRSRCQCFSFGLIPAPKLAAHLAGLLAADGRDADPEAVSLIARRSGGSVRDALSLADQVIAVGGGAVTLGAARALLDPSGGRLAALADAFTSGDARAALAVCAEALASDDTPGGLLAALGHFLADMLLAHEKAGPHLFHYADLPDAVARCSARWGEQEILAGIEAVTLARLRARQIPDHAAVLLEAACVRLARVPEAVASAAAQAALKPAGAAAPAARPARGTAAEAAVAWPKVIASIGPILGRMLSRASFAPEDGAVRLTMSPLDHWDCAEKAVTDRIKAELFHHTGSDWVIKMMAGIGKEQALEAPPAAPQLRETPELLSRAFEIFDATLIAIDDGFGHSS